MDGFVVYVGNASNDGANVLGRYASIEGATDAAAFASLTDSRGVVVRDERTREFAIIADGAPVHIGCGVCDGCAPTSAVLDAATDSA